jgi:hypothetical protein
MMNNQQHTANSDYLWVPVEMCEFTLKNNFTRQLRLYLYLNWISSGLLRMDTALRTSSSSALDISVRTIYRNLEGLLKRNWVGQNPVTKTYFIRGFENVRAIEGFMSRSAAKLYMTNLKDINTLQGFCTAAIVGNRAYRRKWEEGRLNEKSDVHSRTPSSHYFMECSASYLNMILSLSIPTCHRFKQRALANGFINLKKNEAPIEYRSTNIWEIKNYRKAMRHYFIKINRNGVHTEIRPDLVSSNLNYKTRKKIRSHRSGKIGANV